MIGRRVAAALLATAAAATVTGAPTAAKAAAPRAGSVVIVAVPALKWSDVSEQRTPALWRLAGRAAVGSLSVRATSDSAQSVTAPIDGFVTIGAGNRATGRVRGGDDDVIDLQPQPDGGAGFDELRRRNDGLPFDAATGALGSALRAGGVRRVAYGPRAGVALADVTGDIDEVLAASLVVEDTARLRTELGGGAVVAVDVADLAAGTTDAALAAVDRTIAAVADALPADGTLLVVGNSDRYGEPAGLRVAVAAGPEFPRGRLRSATTRRDGFVQLLDVGPTVLELKGLPASADMVGRPWKQVAPGAASLTDEIAGLVDADRAADGYRRYVPRFFLLLVLTQIALYAAAFVVLRRTAQPASQRRRVLAATRACALGFAAVPVSTYLAHLTPWWRHSLGYLVAVVVATVAVVAVVALGGPWRRRPLGPEAVVAGLTFAVITIDLLTGARLQLSSLAGYSPVVAGRFAGIGNVAFAVFATGALLFAAALTVGRSTRAALLIVAAVGVVAVVVDGSPLWGSDFGGVIALVPGFAALALLVRGRPVSWRMLAGTAAGTVLVVLAFALADYARPADAQTHLGRFVGQVLHGGAGAVVRRKAAANLRLLTHSVLTLVVPLAIVFVSVVLLRPAGGLRRAFEAVPPLRAGLIAVLVMSVTGFVSNDSGVAVPALALSVAVPLALAVSLQYVDVPDTAVAGEQRRPRVLP